MTRDDSVLIGHHIDCAFVRAWFRSERAECNCALASRKAAMSATACDCRMQTSHFDGRTMTATCLSCGRTRDIASPQTPPHTEGE